MTDLGAVGFGLEPAARRKAQAAALARATMPYLKEAVQTAHDGKVTWNNDRMLLAFEAIDELAPLVDESEMEEQDKLMIHGVLSGILRMRTSGMLGDRRLQIAAATIDVAVEIYAQIAEILDLQVDRSEE
jgi:hypothetical protein